MPFSFTMAHVPGKDLIVADTLSRAPLSIVDTDNEEFQQEVEAFINSTIQQLPSSEARLKEIMNKQQNDATCQTLTKFCLDPGQIMDILQVLLSLIFRYQLNSQYVMAYYSEVTKLLSHCQCSLKFLESYTVDTKESQNAMSKPIDLFGGLGSTKIFKL